MSDSDPQSSQCSGVLDIESKQYQPDPKFIEVQSLPNKKLRFQEKWYSRYPWLHYSPTLKKVLCFECVKVYTIKKTTLGKKHDPAFCLNVFCNWKNAGENPSSHPITKCNG